MKTLLFGLVTLLFFLILTPMIYGMAWRGKNITTYNDGIEAKISITPPVIRWESYYNGNLVYITSGFLLRLSPSTAIIFIYDTKSNLNQIIVDDLIIEKHIAHFFGVYNYHMAIKLGDEDVTVQSEYGLKTKVIIKK